MRPTKDPTPAEIQLRSAEIRSEWSEAERERRLRFDWRTDRPVEVTQAQG